MDLLGVYLGSMTTTDERPDFMNNHMQSRWNINRSMQTGQSI